MHIVFFVDFHDSTAGGVQTSVRSQKQGLEQAGHQVTVVCPSPMTQQPIDGSDVLLPLLPLFRPNGYPMVLPNKNNLKYIEAKLQKLPPIDIIHIQTNIGVGILGIQFAQKHKIPFVQTMHGRDDVLAESTYLFPAIQSWFGNFFHARSIPHKVAIKKENLSRTATSAWETMVNHAEAADWVTVPSHHFKQKFIDRGLKNNISVISNGLSDDVLKHVKPFREGQDIFRIMWCGRLSEEKRPLEMIDAIALCREGVHLDMYGSGPFENAMRRRIRQYGLEDRISIYTDASQSDVLEQMAAHDILVYNSYGFDNQPMVLLEATASQLPVILCDPDLVECVPPETAVLTADPSPEAIVRTLTKLMASPQTITKMRTLMSRHYDDVRQKTHTLSMIALYKKVIADSKRSDVI